MSNAVLVCAAHPDDEILGCGATMARHVATGDEVHVVIFAQGVFSRDEAAGADELAHLQEACRRANDRLGVATVTLHEFPDNRLDKVDRLTLAKTAEAEFARIRPRIVYTHHALDMNVDHQRVCEAVSIACRPIPGQTVDELYFFEVQSSTGWRPGAPFTPNHFVDVSGSLDSKLDALRIYEPEMRPWPHARSLKAVEHLARWRGSLIGVEAAEAFELGRSLLR